jgi:hypothetical protein
LIDVELGLKLRGRSRQAGVVTRFFIAMLVYAALAALALVTLTDQKARLVTLAILGMFAVRTLLHRRDCERVTSHHEDV